MSPPPQLRARMIDGTARTFLAEALMVPTGLLTVAILTRSLGPSDYGLYTLAVTMVLWLEWGFTAPFARAAVRLVGTAADWEPMAALVVRTQFAVGALMAVLLWLAAPLVARLLDEPALSSLLRLAALDLPLFALAQAHQQVLVGLGRFRERAVLSAARWIIRLTLIAAVVALWSPASWSPASWSPASWSPASWSPASAGFSTLLVHAVVLAIVATSAIDIVLARRFVQPRIFARSPVPARQLFDYAVPLLLSALCLRVFDRIDVVLLKFFGRPAAEVGMYGAAQNLTLAAGLFTVAFAPILLSTLAQAIRSNDTDHARQIVRDAMRIGLLLIPLAALVAASSPDIVSFFFGAQYVAAAPVLQWLIFAGVASAAMSIVVAILTGGGKPFWTLFAAAPLPLAAIGGHMWAIPRYGPLGAAVVTTLVGCAGAVGGAIAVYRLWKVTPPAATALRSVVAAAAAFFMSSGWSWPGPLVIVKLALVGAGVFALLFASGEFGPPRARLDQVSRWFQRHSFSEIR